MVLIPGCSIPIQNDDINPISSPPQHVMFEMTKDGTPVTHNGSSFVNSCCDLPSRCVATGIPLNKSVVIPPESEPTNQHIVHMFGLQDIFDGFRQRTQARAQGRAQWLGMLDTARIIQCSKFTPSAFVA